MFLHVNFDLSMINAKNVIQETKTETETFFQNFKRISLKWSKERRIRRDNFDAAVKQFYVHAIKKAKKTTSSKICQAQMLPLTL